MQFGILGPIEAYDDGRALPIPPGHQRALLALLVVHLNRVLSPERILDAIWGDDLPATGTKAIAYHVSQLRDALSPGRSKGGGAAGLETDPAGYVLRADPDAVDAVRFERLIQRAHDVLTEDPGAARAALDEALALWRGDPLVDVAYADFAQAEIARLEDLRAGALEDRLEADLALGRHQAVVGEAEALLRQQPLRDRLRCLLMLALYRSGRQAEALRVAGDGRRLAAEELGVDPSPELVRLETMLLNQDPALDAGATDREAGARAVRNPFKGLRPFVEADHADFFGREALVRRLVSRLEEVAHAGRLLVLVGPSGSGKSSVVRAGLIPALRAGAIDGSAAWRMATMVPGAAPFRELAAALRGAGADVRADVVDAAERSGDVGALISHALVDVPVVLLVLDQLEELYARVPEDERERFVAGLVAALGSSERRVLAVGTLRADFFDRPLASPALAALLNGGIELVTPMTREELERAITRPSENVGAATDAGLLADLVADVEHHPATLPLLEFALTELFDRSDGRRLGRADYAAIGGATAALARAAEEAWSSLDPAGREVARQALLRFVLLGEGGEATARRVKRADLDTLADPVVVGTVLDVLGRRRLLTFDRDPVTAEPTVEIAHEALLGQWPRLASWVDEQRQALWVRRRVDDAAAEWAAAGRAAGFLATGARLDQFAAWLDGGRLRPTQAESEFIAASLRERRAAAQRGRRRWLAIGAVLISVALVATSLGVTLLGERQAAAERDAITTARGLAAGSIGSLETDPDLSLLLALQAAETTVPRGYVIEEAYDALQWSLEGAHVAFADAATTVRQGPAGPRGMFLATPDDLMRAASAQVDRSLSLAECRTYLNDEACRAVLPPATTDPPLRVRLASGAVVPSGSLAVPSTAGTGVRILSELPADLSPLLAGFEQDTGIDLAWETPRGGFAAALESGDLPDVAIVERPTDVTAAARRGLAIDLDAVIDTAAIRRDAGAYAIALDTIDRQGAAHLYGAPFAATLDDILWYPVDAFARAGYEAPSTLAELRALADDMRRDGDVPWCLGTLASAATQPETDVGPTTMAFVEDLFLDAEGLLDYDRWTAGQLPFWVEGADNPASGERSAAQRTIETFKALVGAPGATYGGLRDAAWTQEAQAALPMVAEAEPRCWLYHGTSTDRRLLAGRVTPVAAVPFPGGDTHESALGRLYEVVVLRDRPEVREVVRTLLGRPLAGTMSVSLASEGFLPVAVVPEPADALAASEMARLRAALGGGTFRVRAIDLFAEPVTRRLRAAVAAHLLGLSPPLSSRMYELDELLAEAAAEVVP